MSRLLKEIPRSLFFKPGVCCCGALASLTSYVHKQTGRPAVTPRRKRHCCICTAPVGTMVTVLGDAKKGQKLKDHYKLGQVHQPLSALLCLP